MKNVAFLLLTALLILGCKPDAGPDVLPETVNSPPEAVIKKIAAWGDSFTSGGGVTMPEFIYPVQLQKLSGYEVFNGGIGGETSTQIKKRMLAAADKKNQMAIIWAGNNNYWAPETIKADIAEMVGFLGHRRFLVISLLNDKYQRTGTVAYTTIIKLNSELKELYKENYLDLRSYLVSMSNGTAQDEFDKSVDVIPGSLRSDDSHPNDKGYGLIAKYIYDNFDTIHK